MISNKEKGLIAETFAQTIFIEKGWKILPKHRGYDFAVEKYGITLKVEVKSLTYRKTWKDWFTLTSKELKTADLVIVLFLTPGAQTLIDYQLVNPKKCKAKPSSFKVYTTPESIVELAETRVLLR